MLSDRRQIVLRALIEEYIARALPVGSRTLVERYNLGISSATVRNELSLLEEMGYLAIRQPVVFPLISAIVRLSTTCFPAKTKRASTKTILWRRSSAKALVTWMT